MRVLNVLNELKMSGAEVMYVDAAPIFISLGAELYVLNTSKNLGEYAPLFEKAGYVVLHKYIKNGIINHWRLRHRIISFLKTERFDVVHVHRSDLAWIFAYCCHQLKIPCVYTYHNVFPSNWYSYHLHIFFRWLERSLWSQKQTSISDSVYFHELNYYHNPTLLIYNWWGNNRFFPAEGPEKETIRRKMGISDNAFVLISVGGCSYIKRHHDIIKTLPILKKYFPTLVYLHLGCGDTLDEEIKLARELGVDDCVRFCGNQLDVRSYLVCSDMYIMTSKFEGISLTTIEAMACHIPCILYNVPGLKDFNRDFETSLLISEDIEILAKSIIDLYNNPQKQAFLIKNAHKNIYLKYAMETNARKMFELYLAK